tara:strand:- start:879 stop:1568 length:690 start_codon:yes stop_codon:yes gene_type:complete
MRHLFSFLIVITLFAFTSCKEYKKPETLKPELKQQTILEKVAYAHGFEHWKTIQQLQFTFNVDRGDTHFERTWNWRTKSNDVLLMSEKDTVAFNRKKIDSVSTKADGAFINDKFWLLAPFNLVWNKANITYTHLEKSEAPISKKPMQKLTIVYGNEGGYTPGDAYDFYFEDDYLIKEWIFRKSNAEEPSMTTTWENYTTQNGLKIALDHENADGNFKLYFTNVKTLNKK